MKSAPKDKGREIESDRDQKLNKHGTNHTSWPEKKINARFMEHVG